MSTNKNTTTKTTVTRRIRKSTTGRPPRYNIYNCRLYVKATFTGFRRGKTTQDENHALLKLEGLNDRKEVSYYLGKRVVYVYRAKKGFRVNKTKFIKFIDYMG